MANEAIRAGEPNWPPKPMGVPWECDLRKPARWPLILASLPLLVSLAGGLMWLFSWDPFNCAAWAGLGLLLSFVALVLLHVDRRAPRRRLIWPAAILGLGLVLMPAVHYGVGEAKDYYGRTPRWTRFTEPDGKWSVLMPAEVTIKPDAVDPKRTMYISSLSSNRGAFIVLVLPIDPGKSPDDALESVKKMWLADPNTRLFKESKVILAGRYAGRDMFIGKKDSELAHHMRFYLVRDECYILNCGSEYLPDSEFTKFLDSFEILEKK